MRCLVHGPHSPRSHINVLGRKKGARPCGFREHAVFTTRRPHDEDPSSSRQVFSVNYVVNVSVASSVLKRWGPSPTFNRPPFSSGLGTSQGGVKAIQLVCFEQLKG